jgi:hypothetical protein
MEAEVVALALSSATTLVGLATTEVWAQAKDKIISVYSRHTPEQVESVQADLMEIPTFVAGSDGEAESQNRDLIAKWQTRFMDLAERNLAVAYDVEQAIQELASQASETDHIQMRATAKDGGRVYQQGRGVQNNF